MMIMVNIMEPFLDLSAVAIGPGGPVARVSTNQSDA